MAISLDNPVDAAHDRLQVIVGDNEISAEYRRDYAQLDFAYDNSADRQHPSPLPDPARQTLNPEAAKVD